MYWAFRQIFPIVLPQRLPCWQTLHKKGRNFFPLWVGQKSWQFWLYIDRHYMHTKYQRAAWPKATPSAIYLKNPLTIKKFNSRVLTGSTSLWKWHQFRPVCSNLGFRLGFLSSISRALKVREGPNSGFLTDLMSLWTDPNFSPFDPYPSGSIIPLYLGPGRSGRAQTQDSWQTWRVCEVTRISALTFTQSYMVPL